MVNIPELAPWQIQASGNMKTNPSSKSFKSLAICRFKAWFACLALAVTFPLEAQSVRNGAAKYPPINVIAENFRQLLERPRTGLAPQIDSSQETNGFTIETGSFQSETNQRVPFLFLRQTNSSGRRPVVISLHGTGSNKESQTALLKKFGAVGISGFAMDGRYHGARIPAGSKGAEEYVKASTRAWREPDKNQQEHPFFYDTGWDLWRALDYLQGRPDVDPDRIGVIGFSKGGIEAWLGASVDTRVRASVLAIAVQSFAWSLENDQWLGRAKTLWETHLAAQQDLGETAVNQKVCRALWTKLIPGILDQFDCPSMIRLFAPRPLLILNGEKDPHCPLPGAELAFVTAREQYQILNATHNLQISVAKGVGHRVTPEQESLAIEWLTQNLK